MDGGDQFFAIHENGQVYALRFDYFTQKGAIEQEREDFINMLRPYPMESLKGRAKVIYIGRGNYHSFTITGKGECITWGQCDNHVSGYKPRYFASGEFVP